MWENVRLNRKGNELEHPFFLCVTNIYLNCIALPFLFWQLKSWHDIFHTARISEEKNKIFKTKRWKIKQIPSLVQIENRKSLYALCNWNPLKFFTWKFIWETAYKKCHKIRDKYLNFLKRKGKHLKFFCHAKKKVNESV